MALTGAVVVLAGLSAPSTGAAGKPGGVSTVRIGEGRTSGSDARLIVRWRGATGASSYQVFYAGSRSMAGAKSLRTTKTGVAVRGLRAGRGYCFRVRALNGSSAGPASRVFCARTPQPVRAARPAWITAQQVNGSTTSLTINWPRSNGATSYNLLYAVSSRPARAHGRKVRTVAATSASRQKTVLTGLTPGRTYCFQVQGRSKTGVGALSAPHCKVTMPTSRKLVPTAVAMKIATFNVCGLAKSCQKWPWRVRRPVVRQHIMMSGADVVAIQEGRTRIPDIDADLQKQGFVKACVTDGAQALFVRTSVFTVVPRTNNGMRFKGDLAHGACWARLRHVATKTEVVVTSLHLFVGAGPGASRARSSQTSTVLGALQRQFGPIGGARTPAFVFAGDFNSHRGHPTDAPLIRLNKAGFDDAYDVSATYEAPYRNSGNGYRLLPPTSHRWGNHLDRVFVPKGASVTGWRTVARVSRIGRYVAPMPSDHNPMTVTVYLPLAPAAVTPPPPCTLIIFC